MNIKNRLPEVAELRCHVCQDFLKMIIIDDWRGQLYSKAKDCVEKKEKFLKEKYINIYNKMRDKGFENYNIDDMDVTIISMIINYCKDIAPTKEFSTRTAFKNLADDRNLYDHLNDNEGDEELYLIGLLSLYNLKKVVCTIDNNETQLDNSIREQFRQKYVAKINEKKELLDAERIELIQSEKDIDKDIKRIINSEKPDVEWCNVHEIYRKRFGWNGKELINFCIKASDAGIKFAHYRTALYFSSLGNYEEAIRRMKLLFNDSDKIDDNDVRESLNIVNEYIFKGNYSMDEMIELIEIIKSKGYSIFLDSSGYYNWENYDLLLTSYQ